MIKRYGFLGSIMMIIWLILTKLFFPSARIIRFPIDIRNKKNIDLGKKLTTGRFCRIEAYPINLSKKKKIISFGDNVQINDFVHISAMNRVTIGNNVLMASKIFISDNNHGTYSGRFSQSNPEIPPINRNYDVKDVVIEDNVWIGETVTILPGVRIGKGSIIGANSVVTKDIPPYCIAVGIPSEVIKKYDFKLNEWVPRK